MQSVSLAFSIQERCNSFGKVTYLDLNFCIEVIAESPKVSIQNLDLLSATTCAALQSIKKSKD